MAQASNKRLHAEWLSLVEVSGPFLSTPVLERVFPQGLDAHDPDLYRTLRLAFEEWEENQEGTRPNPAIHSAWIKFVLKETLGLPDEVLAEGQAIPPTLKATVAEHGETLRPDLVVQNPEDGSDPGKPRLLIQVYPIEQNLEKPVTGRHWKASPATRMMELLHSTDVRLGLVTNGEHWMLVDAPRNETSGFASWYASLWLEEKITLQAFRSLLGVHRFFSVSETETLEAMLAESAKHQQEVTEQLGLQVRRAVEVLIQSLDRADQDHGRQLLGKVPETVLYEAALTVMMRLVILFCAEERGMLLLGDPLYDEHYAVSTLVAQLQESADQHGEEVLERRLDAWARLLATFRAVFGGVEHERMKLLPYAGNLLNPDRFPFLEGRRAETLWRNTAANPLPVNNCTVLHLLRSLQYLELHGEARRLSFRALDIEQIGHVYEGLLDHTAKRAAEPVLGLIGSKGHEPEVALSELERLKGQGEDKLIEVLKEETNRSENALRKALDPALETEEINRLRAACGNDDTLFKRARPFARIIRDDTFGRPVVIPKGGVYVTAGTDRRSSGTHYTPRSLTEPIVQYTLEPLVYSGPADGIAKEEWKLRSPRQLLDLKICDMACGSGAFLVQACRYLSDLLLEAWEKAEGEHPGTPGITPEGNEATGRPGEMLIPKDPDERSIYAKRLIAQRCLYGVDKNPLAVEMAKLSLWLLTLAKDKPFTFLDHAIRCGDSLVGIRDLNQLKYFNLDIEGAQQTWFTGPVLRLVDDAVALRRKIGTTEINTVADVEAEERLLAEAEEKTIRLRYAADLLVSVEFKQVSAGEKEDWHNNAAIQAGQYVEQSSIGEFAEAAHNAMQGKPTFHWPLGFPEVMTNRGFDAFIGNPPFMGGAKLEVAFGTEYRSLMVSAIARRVTGVRGSADLSTYFLLRAEMLSATSALIGMVVTNSLAQGDSREVGFAQVLRRGNHIVRAIPSNPWPGQATVFYAMVWLRIGAWRGDYWVDDQKVEGIDASLSSAGAAALAPMRLQSNEGIAFEGAKLGGVGFVVPNQWATEVLQRNPWYNRVLRPYLTGALLNGSPELQPNEYVITFYDWPLSRQQMPTTDEGPVAEDFPECLSWVEQYVRPTREQLPPSTPWNRKLREFWWHFGQWRWALDAALASTNSALVLSRVTTHIIVEAVNKDWVYADRLTVFADESKLLLAILQSTFHQVWAWRYGTTNLLLLSYSPSACFLTLPLPVDITQSLESAATLLADDVIKVRRQIAMAREVGLTEVYNLLHDSGQKSADIARLRELFVEMDNAVAAAYGWTDLHLDHGFHETKQGVRYTISGAARREVLNRLLELNHARYAEEVREGLHDKKNKAKKPASGPGRRASQAAGKPSLFANSDNQDVPGDRTE